MKHVRYRDARGRFIARPMFCIGEHRIGINTPRACAPPRRPRFPALAMLVRVVVALFSVNALARSWGAPQSSWGPP